MPMKRVALLFALLGLACCSEGPGTVDPQGKTGDEQTAQVAEQAPTPPAEATRESPFVNSL